MAVPSRLAARLSDRTRLAGHYVLASGSGQVRLPPLMEDGRGVRCSGSVTGRRRERPGVEEGVDGLDPISGHPIPIRQRPGARRRAPAQVDSLLLHPTLELGCRLRDEEPIQKGALIEIQRFGVPPAFAGLHKRGCVTPQRAAVYPDFLFATTHDDALAQRATEEAQSRTTRRREEW